MGWTMTATDAQHRYSLLRHSPGVTPPSAPSAKAVGGVVTTCVYDAMGDMAVEYGKPVPSTTTLYPVADHLGSTRLVVDAQGTIRKCYDYLPFGDEIKAGYGTRGDAGTGSCYGTGSYPANPTAVSEEFTGKERDAETGLDYFGARYFSGAQGRFTSPDEFKGGGLVDPATGQHAFAPGPLPYADLGDPQTLNKYGYVRNNPLRYVDPDGHDIFREFLRALIR